MGTASKVIALIGAILGVLSVVLSFVLPEWFGWYRYVAISTGPGPSWFLTGFGTGILAPPPVPDTGIAIWVLIGGIVLIIGAFLLTIGAFKESKTLGVIGGLLMLVGPLLLIVEVLIGTGDFIEFVGLFNGESGFALLWGSRTPNPLVTIFWGVWIGFFLAIAGGFLGLIGGATV